VYIRKLFILASLSLALAMLVSFIAKNTIPDYEIYIHVIVLISIVLFMLMSKRFGRWIKNKTNIGY